MHSRQPMSGGQRIILIDAKDDNAAKEKLQEIDQETGISADFAAIAKRILCDEVQLPRAVMWALPPAQSLCQAFEAALASLHKVGDISKPVKTEFGYHIIKISGRAPDRKYRRSRSASGNWSNSCGLPKQAQPLLKNWNN